MSENSWGRKKKGGCEKESSKTIKNRFLSLVQALKKFPKRSGGYKRATGEAERCKDLIPISSTSKTWWTNCLWRCLKDLSKSTCTTVTVERKSQKENQAQKSKKLSTIKWCQTHALSVSSSSCPQKTSHSSSFLAATPFARVASTSTLSKRSSALSADRNSSLWRQTFPCSPWSYQQTKSVTKLCRN